MERERLGGNKNLEKRWEPFDDIASPSRRRETTGGVYTSQPPLCTQEGLSLFFLGLGAKFVWGVFHEGEGRVV